jgi:hypothetical protein
MLLLLLLLPMISMVSTAQHCSQASGAYHVSVLLLNFILSQHHQ